MANSNRAFTVHLNDEVRQNVLHLASLLGLTGVEVVTLLCSREAIFDLLDRLATEEFEARAKKLESLEKAKQAFK